MISRKARFGGWLAAIAVIGLAVRVAYVLINQTHHLPLEGDSFIYSGGANFLVLGHGWVEPLSPLNLQQTASHPPLYLLWLALAGWVDPADFTSQTTYLLWSCVLGSGTVVLCGFAGREILGPRCGLLAAAVAALYPGVWVHDGSLLSETMALFTSAGVILFAYRFWNRPALWPAIWLGAWCGAAALSRSELALTVVFVLAPIVLLRRERSWAMRSKWLVAGGLAAVLVLAPWVAFNLGRFNERVVLSTSFGRTMTAANCDSTYYGDAIGFKDYDCITRTTVKVVRPEMDESQRDPAFRAEAVRYIKAHLSRVPVVVAARWGRILQLYNPRQEFDQNAYARSQGRWVAEAVFFSFYVVMAMSVVGVVVLRRRRVPVFPLLAFPTIVLISVAITFAQARYRAPAEAALVLLVAVAIDAGLERRAPASGRPLPTESAAVPAALEA